MIRSMTGYSRFESREADFSLAVSVKSTNHRFLDLQVRLPAGLDALEPVLRRLVKEHVSRGHVELAVALDQEGSVVLQIDHRLVRAYAAACQELRSEYGFTGQPDPVTLLRIPGVVAGGNGEIDPAELERIQGILQRVTVEALRRLNEMRAREGESLERDLRGRLDRLRELCAEIDRLSHGIDTRYRQRLDNRIHDLLGTLGLDPGRLAQEVAYLASRSDITEEVTRFQSHLEQCQHLLDEGAEAGKKLDFILQELNREANTLLSKTIDVPEVGSEIGRQAIEMKTEIEKLREQTQNIE